MNPAASNGAQNSEFGSEYATDPPVFESPTMAKTSPAVLLSSVRRVRVITQVYVERKVVSVERREVSVEQREVSVERREVPVNLKRQFTMLSLSNLVIALSRIRCPAMLTRDHQFY